MVTVIPFFGKLTVTEPPTRLNEGHAEPSFSSSVEDQYKILADLLAAVSLLSFWAKGYPKTPLC
jgi:hypothetical protein